MKLYTLPLFRCKLPNTLEYYVEIRDNENISDGFTITAGRISSDFRIKFKEGRMDFYEKLTKFLGVGE